MIGVGIQTLGEPGTFDLTDKDDPLYYTARAAHEVSLNLYHMANAGMLWEQAQTTDITSWRSAMSLWFADLETWLDAAVESQDTGDPVPPLTAFPQLEANFARGFPFVEILYHVLRYIIVLLVKRYEKGTEVNEIANVLKKAMLDEDLSGNLNPILERLGNTPLEIILSEVGDYQDFLYSDRPET
jgi:hypothetical protein